MTPAYHLSAFRFLWDLLTVPGASVRYHSSNCEAFYRVFTWLEFLKRHHLEWGRWTVRFTTDTALPAIIGYVNDFGEFVDAITIRKDGGPIVWQNPWTLQAYRYGHEERTIYHI